MSLVSLGFHFSLLLPTAKIIIGFYSEDEKYEPFKLN